MIGRLHHRIALVLLACCAAGGFAAGQAPPAPTDWAAPAVPAAAAAAPAKPSADPAPATLAAPDGPIAQAAQAAPDGPIAPVAPVTVQGPAAASSAPQPATPAPASLPAAPRTPAPTAPGAPPAAPQPVAAAPAPLPAAPATGLPATSAAELDRIAALLRDEAGRAALLRTLATLAAAARASDTASAATAGVPGAAPSVPAETPAGVAAPGAAPPAAPGTAPEAAPEAAPTPDPDPGPTTAPDPAPADPPLIAPNTVGSQVVRHLASRMDQATDQALAALRSVADLPGLWTSVAGLTRDPVARARLTDAAWKLLLALGAGLALEALLWRALARPRAHLDRIAPSEGEAWGWLRRLPLVAARLALDLLPLIGFALASFLALRLLEPLPTTRLIGLFLAQLWIGARIAFALARMLLAPRSSRLRLIPCADGTAAFCIGQLRRLLLIGLGGYAAAEAGQAIGLSWAAYDAILNLTLLVISLLLARIVLQTRAAVARTLRATPAAPGERVDRARRAWRAVRNRLADVWHILAILWLLAVWVVWALAIEDGFGRLLRGTLVLLAVLGAAKLADEAVRRLLDRALRPGGRAGAPPTGNAPRVTGGDGYAPLLRGVLSTAIAIAATIAVLELWGVAARDWFADGTLGGRLLASLLSIAVTLAIGLIVWEVTNAAIQRRLARLARDTRAARSARVRTLLPMLRTMLGIVILIFTTLSALSQLGVNVAPLLAGAGVIGVAIGFGSQTLVRDVITGVFLLLEDAMAVGDVVQLGGLSGVVEQLTIRSIKLRALDGSVHIVPFSAVTTVTNMTRDFSFAVLDVAVAYAEDTDRVADVLRGIGAELQADPKWAPLIRDEIDVWGIERLTDAGVILRARIKTEPAARWNVVRECNRRIKQRFEALGIAIPSPQTRLVLEAPLPPAPVRAAAE